LINSKKNNAIAFFW